MRYIYEFMLDPNTIKIRVIATNRRKANKELITALLWYKFKPRHPKQRIPEEELNRIVNGSWYLKNRYQYKGFYSNKLMYYPYMAPKGVTC